MPLTIYSNVILPESVIQAGISGRNIRLNQRSQNQGGYDTVNIIWTNTVRQYQLGIIPMLIEQWQAIEGLYEVTEAGAYGFLMQDPKDQSTDAGLLYALVAGIPGGSIGYGYGVPAMNMYKRYTSVGSSRTKDRKITRPKSASTLKRGGSPVTIGVAAGNAAIDYDTGTVTFVADTSQAINTITIGASTILNFSNGTGMVAAMSVGQRVYISGVTGTAATTLNGLSHEISSKGATSLTISTSTTGLAVTVAGTAYKYPQTTESLAWAGEFYVPVHFVNDYIDWDLMLSGPATDRLLAGPSVTLQEVKE
jgi:hypothetical protein